MIADALEFFTEELAADFHNEFEVRTCHDGISALELLNTFQPDFLILNLTLPYKDGLTVLQQSAHQPRLILSITSLLSPYVQKRAEELGVQYLMIMPTVNAIRTRLLDMIATTVTPNPDPTTQTLVHLHTLGFHTHLAGYRQLSIGIPMFAADPNTVLDKELYPAIAAHTKNPDGRTVEHAIRQSIADAWRRRDIAVWHKYFPPSGVARKCPSNKEFLSRIAGMLEL